MSNRDRANLNALMEALRVKYDDLMRISRENDCRTEYPDKLEAFNYGMAKQAETDREWLGEIMQAIGGMLC